MAKRRSPRTKKAPPHPEMPARQPKGKETPGRFVAYLASSFACLGLLVFTSALVPAAFSSPPPNLTDLGAVGVFVDKNDLDPAQISLLDSGAVTITTYLSQMDDSVSYELSFPEALAGKRFVLGLTGSAVLHDFRAAEGDLLSVTSVQCPPGVADCALVSGSVPTDTTSTGASLCFPDHNDVDHIDVRFSGTARINSAPDWAHHITSLPYLGHQFQTGRIGGVGELGHAQLGSTFALTAPQACQFLTRNPQWTDLTPSWPPSLSKGDTMGWNPDDNGAMLTVVSTERSAAWKGNLLLALIGVAGGVLISLVVATYKSGRALRRGARS